MMRPIVFKVQLFRDEGDRERSQQGLLWMLEALCQINEGHLADRPYPPLYEAGVHYQREDSTEEWLDIPSIIQTGWGDCEDLACWRVAELRSQGHRAGPYVRFRKIDGVFHYHALVMHYRPVLVETDSGVVERLVPDHIEDPSRRLGMRPANPVEDEDT
jgi:hypothetical protein